MKVAPGSPAEAAGIQLGDRILAIDAEEMRTSEEMEAARARAVRNRCGPCLTIDRARA